MYQYDVNIDQRMDLLQSLELLTKFPSTEPKMANLTTSKLAAT